METVTLEVKTRDANAKVSDLRRESTIPIEYYGRGVENKSLQADYQGFRKVFRTAGGNTIIVLKVDGKEDINVLIHDVQLDPVSDVIVHVDVINVRMGEELHTKIPLEFTGAAPAVKELAGILMTNINEIEVKCLPKDLIRSIEVSLESLVDFNSFIRIKDLNVPDTIVVLNDLEDVVATVIAPREEEEEPLPAEEIEGEGEEGAEGEEGEEGKEGEEKPKEGGEAKEGGEKAKEGGE